MIPPHIVELDFVDMPEGPRVFASTVVFARSDIPDGRRLDMLIETIAINLNNLRPRGERTFWVAYLGEEVFISLTPGTNRGVSEIKQLTLGFDARTLQEGNDYLEPNARPMLFWSPAKGLFRLWPEQPANEVEPRIRNLPVEHRRYVLPAMFTTGLRPAPPPPDAYELAGEPHAPWHGGAKMKIESLDIRNVMRFERFTATFSPGFNIILGENGSGKTTLLTIIARLLSQWTLEPLRLLPAADVHETIEVGEGTPFRRPHGPTLIGVSGRGPDGLPFDSADGEEMPAATSARQNLVPRAKRLLLRAARDVREELPLLAMFSPWREPPRRRKPPLRPKDPLRRTGGYHGAFDLKADFNDFAAWFKAFEQERLEQGTIFPAVEVARRIVIECIPGCTGFRYVPILNDLILSMRDGTSQPIWRLSDGYRTMLALVGELAWRAAVLNPGLGDRLVSDIGGIVLIDEIDLHLHPNWQRRVVGDLRRAFPNVQFIATTHSPFIVQSLGREEVINLGSGEEMDYWRKGIEDIAEDVMGVPDVPRSAEFADAQKAAETYFQLLREAKTNPRLLSEARAAYELLVARFSEDPAYVALLKAESVTAGVLP